MSIHRTFGPLLVTSIGVALAAGACSNDPRERIASEPVKAAPEASAKAATRDTDPSKRAEALRPAPVREGSVITRGARGEALYIADEDHGVVRVLPLKAGDGPASTQRADPKAIVDVARAVEVNVPGPPAQVLALDGRVLVTIRDPGLLLIMRPDPARGLVEEARVALPPDAWGVAVTPDEATAIVSSPWSNKISAVALDEAALRFSIDVAREPRAIVVPADGSFAYVTHLMGRAITRVDHLQSGEPAARSIDLPPAPASAPIQGHPDAFPLDASLAYSAALSPDGSRLFVPRHALGAYGRSTWFGRSTVDVLLTSDESPLLPPRTHAGLISDAHPYLYADQTISADGRVPLTYVPSFTQPRAIAYRRASKTLLVAGEGDDRLAELDARSLDPALKAARVYDLGGPIDPKKPGETRCGAPSGVALSADESVAFVVCRSTGDLAVVPLEPVSPRATPTKQGDPEPKVDPPVILHLADDALGGQAAIGRRLFYNATDSVMSQGLACAGCHPDGRDDGHVWIEHHDGWGEGGWLSAGPTQDHGVVTFKPGRRTGLPRQTPMLAARVAASGPYGWHGGAKTLDQRIIMGFAIHRWEGDLGWIDLVNSVPRAAALASFLREGLVAPPAEARELTEEEKRGRSVFMAAESMCATCHAEVDGYTDRSLAKLRPLPPPAGFDDEPTRTTFKTPSLLFVGRTAPYFHDGRVATLEALIDQNHDRMGQTEHLPPADRAALVAFLKTIGTVNGDADADASGSVKSPRSPHPRAGTLAPSVAAPPVAAALEDRSSFVKDPPKAEASPKPTRSDWEGAAAVELPRSSPMCEVRRVREWMRVRCLLKIPVQNLAHVTLITGSKEGVELSAEGEVAEIIVPVRRGDRRLLEVDRLVEAWKSWVLYDGTVIVSEAWLPGAPAPEIVITSEPGPQRAAPTR